jgi:ABC-2 type transport system permease protein
MLFPRIRQVFIPAMAFPVILTLAFSGAFGGLASMGVNPYVAKQVDWVMPLAAMQASLFIGVQMGLSLARDIESGFYDRILLTPTRKPALAINPMLSAVTRSLLTVTLTVVTGTILGARLTDGPLGLAMLYLTSALVAMTFCLYTCGIAWRVGTVEKTAPLSFVVVFVSLFTATALVPLEAMQGTWLYTVAKYNPMTQVLAMARQGWVSTGLNWTDTWQGLATIGAIAVLFWIFAIRGLRRRLS